MPGLAPFFARRPAALFQRWRHRRAMPDDVDAEGRPGGHPWATARGSMQSDNAHVEVLVDGHDVFAAAASWIASATQRIHLLQMSFETDFVARFPPGPASPLADAVRDAGARGVDVKLLLSKTEPVDALGYAEAKRSFDGCAGVMVRPFPLRAQLQHAKMMIVDGRTAFLFGSLFVQSYWDLNAHAVVEPRRGKGIPSVGPRPVHDISVRMEGPVVSDVDRCFADLWNHRADVEQRPQERIEPCAPPPPAGDQAVQLVRTLPHDLLADRPQGETDVYEAYLRGFRNATRTIYIENQYLTSPPLAKAIRAAVDRSPGLDVILVLNARLDVPLYLRRQRELLAGLLDHPRIGAFTLWATEAAPLRPRVQRVYVHSKSALIDDSWAALGTANLDGFSLHGAAEMGMPRGRNVETDIILLDGIAGRPATGTVAALRRRLWSEHAGSGHDFATPPDDGWLTLWRRIARANVSALAAGRAAASRILPFVASTRKGGDAGALRSLDIDPDRLDLRG